MRARADTVSPPIGGWNARDSAYDMKPTDARTMENWWPDTNQVRVRRGFESYVDGLGGEVKTLAEYISGTNRKFLAAANGNIWDVSTATENSLGSGFGVDKWQTFSFGSRLFFMNGTDTPQSYNGSTIGSAGFSGSGLTVTDLIGGMGFKGRLYAVEKNSQSFWYGGVDAVTGTLTEFNLSTTGNFGGNLTQLGAITLDAGDGVDDLFLAFMSSGEVIVYQGTDPGVDFTRVGVFKIGSPVDHRGFVKFGGDAIQITQDGYVALSEAFKNARRSNNYQISDKIRGAVSDAIRRYSNNDGWQVIMYPRGNMLLFNVPKQSGEFEQHVMNTNTGAWAKYTGMNAYSWGVYNDELYFGDANGNIFKAETGNNDNGESINATCDAAFIYFGGKGRKKRFTAVRPQFTSTGGLPVAIQLQTDYSDKPVDVNITTAGEVSLPIWGSAVWGVATWGASAETKSYWKTVRGTGYAAALTVKASISNQTLFWRDTVYTYEMGGLI